MNVQTQSTLGWINTLPDGRREPRFDIAVDLIVISKTCGRLKGKTVDLSESGVAALLKIEVPLGELVELEFTLPHGHVKVCATVRQRSAFRYGFQFVESPAEHAIIHTTCRSLDVQQCLSRRL